MQARRGGLGVVRGFLALVVVALPATACSGAPDEEPTPPDPGGDTRVVGSAESVDDVGSQDPTPMTDGTLLALPRAEAERLWELVDHTPSDSDLPYVGGLLEREDVEGWHLAPIDDGRFGLDAPDGDYIVCLLSGEFTLNGCADATIAGPTTWAVTHGEGGFEVSQ